MASIVAHDEEDQGWDWRQILSLRDGSTSDLLFSPVGLQCRALRCEGQVQGVILTSLPPSPPTISTLAQPPGVLYVEYVSVAPWNRPSSAARNFKGTGPKLIRLAVLRSVVEGRNGQVGLHSGGMKATGFYHQLKMSYRGPDPHEGSLDYFDGDAVWADGFFNR